jgi:DNA-binding HxlR family transcriptional regulator
MRIALKEIQLFGAFLFHCQVVGALSKGRRHPLVNMKIIDEKNCPVRTTMDIIGGKWKPSILYYVWNLGACRFGEFQHYIPHITKKMLTQQLRELERDGIVSRKVFRQVPPRVDYSLTNYGVTLEPIMNSMADWGAKHRARKPRPR